VKNENGFYERRKELVETQFLEENKIRIIRAKNAPADSNIEFGWGD